MSSLGCSFESADKTTADPSKELVLAPTVFGLHTGSVTEYSWECKGALGVCDDFHSQIESKTSVPTLTLPAGLFSQGEMVALSLSVHGQPADFDFMSLQGRGFDSFGATCKTIFDFPSGEKASIPLQLAIQSEVPANGIINGSKDQIFVCEPVREENQDVELAYSIKIREYEQNSTNVRHPASREITQIQNGVHVHAGFFRPNYSYAVDCIAHDGSFMENTVYGEASKAFSTNAQEDKRLKLSVSPAKGDELRTVFSITVENTSHVQANCEFGLLDSEHQREIQIAKPANQAKYSTSKQEVFSGLPSGSTTVFARCFDGVQRPFYYKQKVEVNTIRNEKIWDIQEVIEAYKVEAALDIGITSSTRESLRLSDIFIIADVLLDEEVGFKHQSAGAYRETISNLLDAIQEQEEASAADREELTIIVHKIVEQYSEDFTEENVPLIKKLIRVSSHLILQGVNQSNLGMYVFSSPMSFSCFKLHNEIADKLMNIAFHQQMSQDLASLVLQYLEILQSNGAMMFQGSLNADHLKVKDKILTESEKQFIDKIQQTFNPKQKTPDRDPIQKIGNPQAQDLLMDKSSWGAWDHTLFQFENFAMHVTKLTNEKFKEDGLIHFYNVLDKEHQLKHHKVGPLKVLVMIPYEAEFDEIDNIVLASSFVELDALNAIQKVDQSTDGDEEESGDQNQYSGVLKVDLFEVESPFAQTGAFSVSQQSINFGESMPKIVLPLFNQLPEGATYTCQHAYPLDAFSSNLQLLEWRDIDIDCDIRASEILDNKHALCCTQQMGYFRVTVDVDVTGIQSFEQEIEKATIDDKRKLMMFVIFWHVAIIALALIGKVFDVKKILQFGSDPSLSQDKPFATLDTQSVDQPLGRRGLNPNMPSIDSELPGRQKRQDPESVDLDLPARSKKAEQYQEAACDSPRKTDRLDSQAMDSARKSVVENDAKKEDEQSVSILQMYLNSVLFYSRTLSCVFSHHRRLGRPVKVLHLAVNILTMLAFSISVLFFSKQQNGFRQHEIANKYQVILIVIALMRVVAPFIAMLLWRDASANSAIMSLCSGAFLLLVAATLELSIFLGINDFFTIVGSREALQTVLVGVLVFELLVWDLVIQPIVIVVASKVAPKACSVFRALSIKLRDQQAEEPLEVVRASTVA